MIQLFKSFCIFATSKYKASVYLLNVVYIYIGLLSMCGMVLYGHLLWLLFYLVNLL